MTGQVAQSSNSLEVRTSLPRAQVRAQIQSLLGKRRFHKLYGMAEKKKVAQLTRASVSSSVKWEELDLPTQSRGTEFG